MAILSRVLTVPRGLVALWTYRNFVSSAIRGELKSRFARSKLGAIWLVLLPLAQAAVFALVLSEVLVARLPGISDRTAYAAYLLAGIAAWGLFSEIVNRCTTIFIEYANALKKIAFPRLCLPTIVAGGALLNHGMLLVAILLVFLLLGRTPGAAWIALPIGITLIAAFGFGLGILLGTANTFARDVGQVVGIFLQFWFWLTPIVYSIDTLPSEAQWIAKVNPFTPIARLYQDALVFDKWPDLASLIYPGAAAALLVLVALLVFRRASADLVDAL